MTALADNCRELTAVNVSDCRSLTDSAVVLLATHCRRLTKVALNGCKLLTDATVISLATHCHRLTVVELNECKLITDAAVVALATHHRQLTAVEFTGCELVTDAALVPLADAAALSTLKIGNPWWIMYKLGMPTKAPFADAGVAGLARCTSLSGSISTILTILSWICAGISMCGALLYPVRA